MNSIIHYGSVQGNPLYNCSVLLNNVYIPGTKRSFLGHSLIFFGIAVEILYAPCLVAIVKRNLLKHSCYKIMFWLGFVDMIATAFCTILTGYLFIEGAVFCSYPNLIDFSGCFALSSWLMSCSSILLLVINRVSDIVFPELSEFLFSNNRTWLMIMIPVAYVVYAMFFTPTICFNSTIMAWIGDAGIVKGHSAEYYNYVQIFNNIAFIFGTIFLYTVYCFFMQKRTMGVQVTGGKQVFVQSALVCSINCCTTLIYTVMMFVTPHPVIVLIGQLAWSMVHACPAFFYWTVNRTIRNEIMSWVKNNHKTSDISTSIHQSQILPK